MKDLSRRWLPPYFRKMDRVVYTVEGDVRSALAVLGLVAEVVVVFVYYLELKSKV